MRAGFQAPELVSIQLFQAGTYNPQYRRPIDINVTVAHCDAFDQATQGGTVYTPGHLSGLVNNMITLNLEPERSMHTFDGSVPIPYGWQSERCRFVLELVEHLTATSRQRHFYIGYTDAVGFIERGTRDAAIDAGMQFYVNNVVSVIENEVFQQGVLSTVSRVSRCDSYLTGMWGKNQPDAYNDYSCRPQEVIDHMATGMIMNQAAVSAPINNSGATFAAMKVKSSNSLNNRPVQYLSRILESYAKSSAETHGGYLEDDLLLKTASGYGGESLMAQEPLFRLLPNNAVTDHGFFTFAQISHAAPHADQVTHVHKYDGTGMFGAAVAGTTEYMHTQTIETHIDAIINSSLPSIMMENLFRSLHIHVSNNVPGYQPHCEMIPRAILPGENMPRPSFVMLTPNADFNYHWDRFRSKVIDELFRTITQNYVLIVDMVIDISITGDISCIISVEGKPPIDYRNPCFCDQLTSTLTTNNATLIDRVANDVYSITNHAYEKQKRRGEAMQTNEPFGPADTSYAQSQLLQQPYTPQYTPRANTYQPAISSGKAPLGGNWG